MKVHLACGKRDFGEGWIHIDGGDYDNLDYDNITKLPFDNDTVSLIYCSHALEYFDRDEAVNVLKEWKRVLKAGGVLRLAVPNFAKISKLYSFNCYDVDNFLGPLYGKMKMGDEWIYHKTCYDFKSLKDLLLDIGFICVRKYDWRQTEHAEFDDHSQAYIPKMDKENGTLISLNVECNA